MGSSIAGVDNTADPSADPSAAPATPKKKLTVAARFLITTTPDQMAVVARSVSDDTTVSKFDQQLKTAGERSGLSHHIRFTWDFTVLPTCCDAL